jgi:hypothetical protein
MVNDLKKISVFSLIPSFLFVSVFCCCWLAFPQLENARPDVQQARKTVSAHSHCDSRNAKDERPDKKNHDCGCPYLQGALAQENVYILHSTAFAFLFSHLDVSLAKIVLGAISDDHLWRPSHSPPRLTSRPLPLYLKHTVFRI